MTHVRIGPSRVRLGTWAEVVEAAREGLLDETAYCELKADLPPPSQNVEVSRDLASLSVYGGVLVVGIKDKGKNQAGEVVGVESAEVRMTRLVALADGVVQPSLVCDVWVVSDPDNPDRGRVVCVVPPSSVAPHRVDDRYWGRTSEGKRVLSDPEVAELFGKRRHRDDDFATHLQSLRGDFDPVDEGARAEGHLYFAARCLQPQSTSAPWDHNERVIQVINRAGMPPHGYGGGDLSMLTYSETHPFGIQATSVDLSEVNVQERWAHRLLIRDEGGLDYAYGNGTVSQTVEGCTMVMVHVPAVAVRIDQCVRLTASVAKERGEHGNWRLGVFMDRLLGVTSSAYANRSGIGRPTSYPEREYLHITDATNTELLDAPEAVVERLLAPLARGLGAANVFPYSSPDDLFK